MPFAVIEPLHFFRNGMDECLDLLTDVLCARGMRGTMQQPAGSTRGSQHAQVRQRAGQGR